MSIKSIFYNKACTKTIILWVLTVSIPCTIMLIPETVTLTYHLKIFFAITIIAIMAFCFEHIPMTVAAIMLPVFYVIFKIAPAATCFASWSNHLPWMILGGLVFAEVLIHVGLAKRIAYKCILVTGCSYSGVLWGILLAGLILTLLIPSNAAYPLAALTYGMCRALGFGKSKESAGIMLTGVMSSQVPWCFMFYPYTLVLFEAGVGVTGPIEFTWLDYIINNGPGLLLLLLVVFIMTKMFKPEKPFESRGYFEREYKALGKMSLKERKAMIISLLLFVSMLTSSWHKIDIGWCFLFFSMLFFVPGIHVGTDELKRANFSFVIFVASCMTIGNVGSALGVGQLITEIAIPVLAGKSTAFVLLFAWFVAVIANFLLTPLAICAAFAVPFAQIATDLGINPIAMYFAMINGMDQILMPYEYANYLLYFSFGLIWLKDFIKIMGLKMILSFVFMAVVMIPYWYLIGFINP